MKSACRYCFFTVLIIAAGLSLFNLPWQNASAFSRRAFSDEANVLAPAASREVIEQAERMAQEIASVKDFFRHHPVYRRLSEAQLSRLAAVFYEEITPIKRDSDEGILNADRTDAFNERFRRLEQEGIPNTIDLHIIVGIRESKAMASIFMFVPPLAMELETRHGRMIFFQSEYDALCRSPFAGVLQKHVIRIAEGVYTSSPSFDAIATQLKAMENRDNILMMTGTLPKYETSIRALLVAQPRGQGEAVPPIPRLTEVLSVLERESGSVIADVGQGLGMTLREIRLRSPGCITFGVDLADYVPMVMSLPARDPRKRELIRFAQTGSADLLEPSCDPRFVEATAASFSLPVGADLITCIFCLPHEEDRLAAIANIHNNLKVGGIAYILALENFNIGIDTPQGPVSLAQFLEPLEEKGVHYIEMAIPGVMIVNNLPEPLVGIVIERTDPKELHFNMEYAGVDDNGVVQYRTRGDEPVFSFAAPSCRPISPRHLDAASEAVVAACMENPLFAQAVSNFDASGAAAIDNRVYWEKLAPTFEAGKRRDDRTSPEQIEHFLGLLGPPDRSIFEIAMGAGRAAELFLEHGYFDYRGIDLSQENVALARQRLSALAPERLIAGDFMTYDADTRSDGVFASDILLYMSPQDQIRFLLKAAADLNEEGLLYLRWAPGDNTVKVTVKQVKGETVTGWAFTVTPEYLEFLLDAAGFDMVEPVREVEQLINVGTQYERLQKFWTAYARKRGIPTVARRIEEKLLAYRDSGTSAGSRDNRYLQEAVPLINNLHRLVGQDAAAAYVFRAIWENVAAGESIVPLFQWLENNTCTGFLSIADQWSMAVKTESGDGAWGPMQRPEHQLDAQLSRNDHILLMVQAGQAILLEVHNLFRESAYRVLTDQDDKRAEPNVSEPVVRRTLALLSQNSFLPQMQKLVPLGLVFHDIGQILKNRVSLNRSGDGDRLDARHHRVSGSHFAGDLLKQFEVDPFDVEAVELLIRQHDAMWNLYCLDKYGDYNSFTTAETLMTDVRQTVQRLATLRPEIPPAVLTDNLLRMIALAGIADVFASGDRYLSDAFLIFVEEFLSRNAAGDQQNPTLDRKGGTDGAIGAAA